MPLTLLPLLLLQPPRGHLGESPQTETTSTRLVLLLLVQLAVASPRGLERRSCVPHHRPAAAPAF
jgi:hypothetical protein